MIFKLCSVAVLLAGAAAAQINIPSIVNVLADPSGTCASPGTPLQYNTQLNHLSACQGASPGPYNWALVSGGGGGSGTVTSIAAGQCLSGGTITTSGTIALAGGVNPQTATYQVLASDFSGCKTITVASGTFTITLVASGSQPANGQAIGILNYGTGTVTVAPSGQNINGSSSNLTIGPGTASAPSGGYIKSDGTNYFAGVSSSVSATNPLPRSAGGLNSSSAGTGLLRDGTTPTASELSGDCTTSGSNAVTCTRINGTAFAGTNGDVVNFGADNIPVDSGVLQTNIPTQAANGTSGGIPYYAGANKALVSSGALTVNVLPKGGGAGAAPINSSITDNGTTVATTETVTIGPSPPACTGGTAGGLCWTEGTAITNVAGTGALDSNSTTHELEYQANGSALKGMMVRAQPGNIRSTGLTGAVTTATLCAASAGACNTAGQYHIHWVFYEGGTACAVPGTGGVTFLLTWTDGNATTHSAVSLGMDDAGAINAVSQTFHFQTSLAAAWGSGDFNVDTNGAIIQYATGYTACGTGTGTYALSIAVTRLQ